MLNLLILFDISKNTQGIDLKLCKWITKGHIFISKLRFETIFDAFLQNFTFVFKVIERLA